MTKRILALTLCIVMLCLPLAACASKKSNDNGAYIAMYLTDNIYDFDPANAYYSADTINVLNMMYDTLFRLDENGKVVKSLVKSYKIVENAEADEYYVEFKLNEAYWNVKDQVTADDVVFAWKRLVDFQNNYEAASLLYDVKNARAIKEGDVSIDDLGVEAVEDLVVRVSFDQPIDYDRFFLNLTSVATAPLLKRYVSSNPDWAKKASTIATSGPFKLGIIKYEETKETVPDDNALDKTGEIVTKEKNKVKKISYFYLERNTYYYRDTKRDAIDASVTPYRLLVDCTKTAEELLEDFQNGHLFYIGNIPLSLRTGDNAELIKKEAKVSDSLSTFVCYLNENALINDGGSGSFLFADPVVRQALSKAIDRQAIAERIVFAEAATALVPNGVFEKGTSGEFRTSKLATSLLSSSAQIDEAKAMLTNAGVNAAKYSFSIKVAAYDEIHVTMAEMVAEAWKQLGFNVSVELSHAIENNDYFDQTTSVPPDVCDDLFIESLQRGKFEVIALDATAYSADAFSVLSNYAYAFSGSMYADTDNDIYEYDTHATGYDSVAYNILMEAVYYIPYFASLNENDTGSYVSGAFTNQPYVEAAGTVLRKLNDSVSALNIALQQANTAFDALKENANTALNSTDAVRVNFEAITNALNALNAQAPLMEVAAKQAIKNIVSIQSTADLTSAAQTTAQTIVTVSPTITANVPKALEDATALDNAIKKYSAALSSDITQASAALEEARTALANATESIGNVIKAAENTMSAANNTVSAMNAAADAVNKITLYDAIKAIYDENGIVPTTKKSKWAEQRAQLLHKAEELLMTDLPVIPVVYNQNAIMTSKQLSKVTATYYTPAFFRKTKLKDYADYIYFDEKSEKYESIYKNFPVVEWDKMDSGK